MAVGLSFLAAATFNVTVTRHEAPRVFARMPDDAWLPPWRWLLRRIVIPHGPAVAVGAAAYEVAVGLCVLGRGGLVTAGLLGGAAWAVVTTPVLPPAQAAGNFALAPALLALASRSYASAYANRELRDDDPTSGATPKRCD